MSCLRYRAPKLNHSVEMDLFAWANQNERRHRFSIAARIIARRYNIAESRAALVCEIAGIGRGAE
jgi:hypothetical protein